MRAKRELPRLETLFINKVVGVLGTKVEAMGMLAGGDFPFVIFVAAEVELDCMERRVGVGGTFPPPGIGMVVEEDIRFAGSLGRAMGIEKAI